MTGPLTIVSLVPLSPHQQEAIESIGAPVELIQCPGWFDGEIRDTWGAYVADSYLRPGSMGFGTRGERDAVLATAEVIIGGFPMPKDLRSRAPRLRWVHQTPAGASNLHSTDLWESDVLVTTSRGLGNTLAIAEYVVASFLHFARGLNQASVDEQTGSFNRFAYKPILVSEKTVCVVGAGGIGQDVGRLCAGLGLRVVGTRRSPDGPLPPGFSEVAGPERLLDLLAESTFVAVCCQWTPETQGLIGEQALAAMPDGAVIANVARGEVVDEAALTAGLDRLRGVALDVYVGEFEHGPPKELWSDPRVLITPHVSAGSDGRAVRPMELFVENLRTFVADEPLRNVVDWSRGY